MIEIPTGPARVMYVLEIKGQRGQYPAFQVEAGVMARKPEPHEQWRIGGGIWAKVEHVRLAKPGEKREADVVVEAVISRRDYGKMMGWS